MLLAICSAAVAQPAGSFVPELANQNLDPNSMIDDLGLGGAVPISHPGRRYPATNDFPTGPEIGELFPDFSLRNQHGELINFNQATRGSRAIVDFYRSALW